CTSGGDGDTDFTRPLARQLLARRVMDFSAALTAVLSAVLIAGTPSHAVAQEACIVLEDFSRAKVDEFPPDWKPRKEEGREIYRVREEGNERFLRAEAKGTGIQAGKETPRWDLEKYPILTWSWRP